MTPDTHTGIIESMRKRQKRIALLVQTATAWSRQVLAGVAEKGLESGVCEFALEPRGFYESIQVPDYWSGDGVICRLTDDNLAREIRRRKIPAVNVSWLGEHSTEIPKVVSDEIACGRMAAEFFLERGWTNFGVVGFPPTLNYSGTAENTFAQVIQERGHRVSFFEHEPNVGELNLGRQLTNMADWLLSLAKPTAVLVWTTTIAHEISLTCRRANLSVPDDIAILAIEVDPLISSLAPTPIAYIDQSPRRVGACALELLLEMIDGSPAPELPILIPPRSIAERTSVDTVFVQDELVRSSIQYMREKINLPIQVSDIATAMKISRRVLESRFERALKCSPAEVIRRSKLTHAIHLLGDTSLTVNEVALRCGYFHMETFLRFFKRETGQTPTEFRATPKKIQFVGDDL
jgi:LacI family transcriptional regulator